MGPQVRRQMDGLSATSGSKKQSVLASHCVPSLQGMPIAVVPKCVQAVRT